MYLIGAAHPHKTEAQILLERLIAKGERLVTDAEVLQEILHRYVAIHRRDAIDPAIKLTLDIVDQVFPVEKADVLRTSEIVLSRGRCGRATQSTSPSWNAKYATLVVNNSPGAVYKGLAIATDTDGTTRLYATNFRAGTVDVFNTSFQPVNSVNAFADPSLPRGYAPFNIVPITTNGTARMFVTYAVQDADKHDDVAGQGHGIVNTFHLDGSMPQRFAQHGQLDSPWGVVMAPAGFGSLGGTVWIGNFGNGHIDAFDPMTGELIDKVRDSHGQAVVIDGLWSIKFGNGGGGGLANTLYFTAGVNGEQDGMFGSLAPQ